ncbi:MAG: PKD domain-containing protein, partial [Chitinophagaceae bacterium]
WDFGDGSPVDVTQNPSHAFTSLGCGTGTFNVKLTITDANGCKSTVITKPVSIKQAPDVRLTDTDIFTPFSNCDKSPTPANPNFTLTVTNGSVGTGCIVTGSYVLDWGDGSPVVNNPTFPLTHTYTQLGAFDLTLTATGTNGCTYTKKYVVANQSNPAGGLGTLGSTTGLCAPFNIPFIISNWQNNSPGTKYLLEFGDGTSVLLTHPLTSDTVFHNYTTTSCPTPTYTARLRVINACDSTPYTAGNIQIRIKPTAAFTSPLNGCVNQQVCFTNTTAAGFTGNNCSTTSAWSWDFGDGTAPSTAQNPCHTYTAPGIYTVTLTASNPCGPSTFTKQICITGLATSVFTLNKTEGCAPQLVTTNNTSVPGSLCVTPTYKWTVAYSAANCGSGTAGNYFVSGTKDTSTNPVLSFTNPGTYTITLAVTNACGTVTSSKTMVVTSPPKVMLPTIPNACSSVTVNPSAGAT